MHGHFLHLQLLVDLEVLQALLRGCGHDCQVVAAVGPNLTLLLLILIIVRDLLHQHAHQHHHQTHARTDCPLRQGQSRWVQLHHIGPHENDKNLESNGDHYADAGSPVHFLQEIMRVVVQASAIKVVNELHEHKKVENKGHVP